MNARKILVAEDEPDLLWLIQHRLEKTGYDVLNASDGDEALRLAREEHPLLCLLDVMMPGLNGIDVLREIRSDETMDGTKVILLSARSHKPDVDAGLAMGADEYLVKPVSPAVLLSTIEQQLEGV